MNMNKNLEFELFTQRVYRKLESNGVFKPSFVRHNVKLRGKSGCEHQIDVYWEYENAGTLHRVVIECKNYNSYVPIGKVRDFYGVLQDLDNVRGIMVSSKGYQKGAKKYADYHGISLKTLRRPGWNESIGVITTSVHTDIRHTLYLIDENWISEHNFSLDRLRRFYAEFQFDKAYYWKTATHFPIQTNDHIIRDSQGNDLASIDNLGLFFLTEQLSGTSLLFPFKDAWIDSYYWGPVKIREVKFEYESEDQETTWNLAADDFVEAILEDALSGESDYVPKY